VSRPRTAKMADSPTEWATGFVTMVNWSSMGSPRR
jgi:hypothetical protein